MKPTISIVGHLGRDPEYRTTQGGTDVATFSVAASVSNKDDAKPMWFRVTCWRPWQQDLLKRHLRQGSAVTVTGELSHSHWMPNGGGSERTSLEVDAIALTPHRYVSDSEADGQDKGTNPEGRAADVAVTDEEIPW